MNKMHQFDPAVQKTIDTPTARHLAIGMGHKQVTGKHVLLASVDRPATTTSTATSGQLDCEPDIAPSHDATSVPHKLRVVYLQHGWKVIDTRADEIDPDSLSTVALDTSAWLPIAVPGDVNAALVAAGRMPSPHWADDARQCYWPTSRDWWYRLEFVAPEPAEDWRQDLVLDGIDGHAEIYLNGQKLGRMENAFRPGRFDVTALLRPSETNVLLIRFIAIEQVLGGPREHELYGWEKTRCLMRKPQFSFGWDWALPVPSIGIAGIVRLEQYAGPRLADVSVQPVLSGRSGRLDFKFHINTSARDAGAHLELGVNGPGVALHKCIQRPGRTRAHTSVTIESPELWWPRGMGEQPLYDWSVDLVCQGHVIETHRGRAGMRQVRLLEEPFTEGAGPGISFWIEINGQRVFCKGGNWIPLELWPPVATDDQYRFYLARAAEANFNMLRVWGGGIYERELFYDLCDEMGIMVWQDFMFAGSGYPVDHLRHEIIAEAEYQVRRLRNRPSIVLWCGCNEDVHSWSSPDEKADVMSDQIGDGPAINRLTDDPQIYSMILRGTVSRLGLGVPFVESSPQSYEDIGNDPASGNSHISCWKHALFNCGQDTQKFRDHFEAVCSFDSEFCIQGPCDIRTIQQFLPPEHHWPPDEMWIYHIQRGHNRIPHCEQTLKIAGGIFGPIDSLQKYVKYGQATHAEMMRCEFESARRDRPNNGGTMVWMFNDCWPTANWSIIDYFRRPKPSYYAARRACAIHLPIIFERDKRIEFFFSNDGREGCQVQLVYGQQHLDGSRVWERRDAQRVGPCETIRFDAISRDEPKGETDVGDYLFIDAIVDGRALPRITYFPDGWKDIPWPTPKLDLQILDQTRRSDGFRTRVKLGTDRYARFCHLLLPGDLEPFWLDDSFFDLCPGPEHERVLTITSAAPLDLTMIRAGHWWTDWQ